MEWHDVAMEAEDEDGAFTLVHEGPDALTAQQQKGHRGKASSQAELTHDLQLAAFPELFKREPAEQRLARAAAAQQCWDALAQRMQETLEATDAEVFQELLRFAQQSHRPPAPRAAGLPEFAGCQRVPTGLVLAGGVNSADHCHTFPRLAAFLRQHGCYAALLHPHSLGKVPGDAIGEVLRQLSGMAASKAEHMDALRQWYQDETGAGRQQAAAAAGGEAAAAPGGDQQARGLRQRPAAAAAAGCATAAQLASRQRPLVVIVEGTESVDEKCLRDFILTASESYQDVPLTLVLGLTTTAAALHGLLPPRLVDRCLEMQHFRLASAMTRLDGLVQQVLLGGGGRWPGLLFSRAILSKLTDAFLNHYYSTGCIMQGLKVASLSHFLTQPLSFLAAAAVEGPAAVEQACADLDPATLAQARQALGGRTNAQLAAAVGEAMAGWSRWCVGLQWLLAAAEAAGHRGQDFRPWKVIEEALVHDFAAGQLQQLLGAIEPQLRRLPAAAAEQLAMRLLERAAAVWGGVQAAAGQLEQLAALAGGQAEAEEKAAEEEEQQQAPRGRRRSGAEAAAAAACEAGEAAAADADLGGGGKQQGKAKHDRFHSRQSRNAALLQKSAQQGAAKGGASAAAAAAAAKRLAQEAASPGAGLAAWLAPALRELLAAPPTKLPGASVFTCRDAGALDCLTAEPRVALHMALTEPHLFLPGLPDSLGLNAAQDDACLAYSIFDQDPKCVNLADWYQAFAAVHEGAAQPGGSAGPAGKKRKAAVKKAKKAAKKDASGSRRVATEGEEEQEGQGEERRRVRELTARFSQATAELQYVGLIKPARRRRGDYVHRVVHMPAAE